jgi:hypothetical protein
MPADVLVQGQAPERTPDGGEAVRAAGQVAAPPGAPRPGWVTPHVA